MAVSEIVAETEKIVRAVANLADTVSQVVDKATEGIESMTKSEIKVNTKVRNAYHDLKDTATKAAALVEKVNYTTQIGSDRNGITAITTKLLETATERKRFWRVHKLFRRPYTHEVSNPDYKSLKLLIDQIQSAISRIEQAYLEFEDSLQKALQTTNKAIDECKHCERQARQKQTTVATKGALSTAIVGTVTGVVATVFGGPVAGIASAVLVAGAGGAVTYTFYKEYAQLQEAFIHKHRVLDKWYNSAFEMKQNVDNVHQAMETFARVVEDLEQSQPDQLHINNLCCTLNQMTTSFSDMNSTTIECRKVIRKANTKMDAGLNKVASM